MPSVKVFVSDSCPNCPPTKELARELDKKGVKVETYNIRSADGLAESLMYDVLSTPSTLILNSGGKVKAYLGVTPNISEVLEVLNKK